MIPARRSPRAWCLLLMVTLAGLGADLWSKSWAFASVAESPVVLDRTDLIDRPHASPIPPHPGWDVLPAGLLDFRLVLNQGAVFGIGAQQRGLLVGFTLIAVTIALFMFGWKTDARQRLAHVGIALVLAGALGNLWDRVVYGRVRDFLHMLPDWHLPFGLAWPGGNTEVWPWIFNIADVLLLAGLAVILIAMHHADKAAREAANAGQDASAA